ncbi:hypothetical protein OOT00_13015 [Desulfobotulus sp. H1]|uniref:O-antigen ligase domain-containing protein n=1 Tax=Desulfobotulus pelophilus TaxID=2823377 RepID=A0ABT3NCK3_9BACT|nr:hypothetical protein [Desulfobotulus pelophilus]MCW7754906.1 hypothetical protein [Desulfobotulus pelophilus]
MIIFVRKKRIVWLLFFIAFAFCLKLIFSIQGMPDLYVYSGDILFAFILLYSYFKEGVKKEDVNLLTAIATFILIYAISSYWSGSSMFGAFKASARIFLPIMVCHRLLFYSNTNIFYPLIFKLACLVILLGILLLHFGFVYLEPMYERYQWWPPAYFQNRHSTAYVVLSMYILFCALFWNTSRYRYSYDALVLIVTFYYINNLLGVRTAVVALFVFIAMRLFKELALSYFIVINYLLMCIMVFYILEDPFNAGFSEYSNLSSGRLSIYLEKMNQLANNAFLNWFIGNGYGSDLTPSLALGNVYLNAHNDFLSLFIEVGFIGVLTFLIAMLSLYERAKAQSRDPNFCFVLFVVFLSTSIISNGIMVRPIASYLFFLSIVALAKQPGLVSVK